jgi:AcrR family transcriptional regulator
MIFYSVMATATAQRPANRRRDILDAALEVFTRRGYHRAGIEEIRDVSGASIGSIYHHFGGKEQLAAAVYLEGLRDYQERFLHLLGQAEGPEETVKAIVANHLRWVADNPKVASYLMSSRDVEVVRATDPELRSMNRAVIAATREWIEREVAAGAMREMSTALLYAVLIGPCQEFARQWVKGRDRKALAEAQAVLADAAWRAVRA